MREFLGQLIGLSGVAVLVGLSSSELGRVHPVGAAVILGGALCWSLGSLHSRRAELPSSPAMTVAIQMLGAGVVLLVVSSVLREWQSGFSVAQVTVRSAAALVYLGVFGSMVTLCAYVWLLRRVSAAAVGTYAFVNPVVAVVLGWALAGETLGPRIVAASVLIVSAVVLIQSSQWRRTPAAGVTHNLQQARPVPEPASASGSAAAAHGPATACPSCRQ